jgi:cytochrome c biogenesis protein CcmG, thiol:disulfide interchange protein DsbE
MTDHASTPGVIAPPSWSRRVTVALTIIVLVALIGTLAISFRRDPRDIRSGSVGKAAAAFTLERLDGNGQLSLSDFQGRVVIINLWASWCVPCKQENPALNAVWERYRSSADFVMIGIVYQDSVDAAREYTRLMGNTWPSVLDPDGRTAFAYGVFGIPETYFITPDGQVAGRHIGAIDQATLVKGIEAIRHRETGIPSR